VIEDEEKQSSVDTLKIKQLLKCFGTSDSYLTAVDHLNLTLNSGEIFALLGHNGAGKTTTISMLTGMLESSAGSVTCYGKHMMTDNQEVSKQQLKQDLEYI